MSGKAQALWTGSILLFAIAAIGFGPVIFAILGIGIGGWIVFEQIRVYLLSRVHSDQKETNDCEKVVEEEEK